MFQPRSAAQPCSGRCRSPTPAPIARARPAPGRRARRGSGAGSGARLAVVAMLGLLVAGLGAAAAAATLPATTTAGVAAAVAPVPTASVLAQRGFELDAGPPLPRSMREHDPGQWEETEAVQLPPWPRAEDLVTVPVDGDDGRFTYRIDARSLRTSPDGVVRYTLVAEAAGGARNVSYEGLRCTPHGTYKIYAYGADQGFIATAIADDWLPIERLGADRLRYDLWRHYLCVPRLFQPRPRDEQLRLLRSGRVPRVENRGFLSD